MARCATYSHLKELVTWLGRPTLFYTILAGLTQDLQMAWVSIPELYLGIWYNVRNELNCAGQS